MMTLVRICGQHRHAVERDLVSLGFDGMEDLGTPRLSVFKLAHIVLASQPGTAVYHAVTRSGPLTPEAQLLAKQVGFEFQDGPQPQAPQAHRGYDELAQLSDYNGIKFEPMPHTELLEKRERIAQALRDKASGKASERSYEFKMKQGET